jgi:beta-galactosidase
LDGVDWDVRGVLALAHTEASNLGYYWPTPHGFLGIAVNRKCERLHFLHAAMNLWTELPSIGRYRLHYADGTTHDFLLEPGVDIGHWWTKGEMSKATAGRRAWEGSNVVTEREQCHTALFHRAWDNPFPGKVITTIDFLSDEREPVPFLVALTVE